MHNELNLKLLTTGQVNTIKIVIFSNLLLLEWLSSKRGNENNIIGKEMGGKESLDIIGGNAD